MHECLEIFLAFIFNYFMIKEKKCEVLSMTGIAKLYRKNYNNLTKAEKQIAEYICENSKKVIMMIL